MLLWPWPDGILGDYDMLDSTENTTATRSILVVEDDELNMKLFSMILTLDGYGVTQAFDAERALALIEEDLPDLIVMDIQLPGMDGIEAVKILKASERTWLIPVVAVTGYAMKEDRERCLSAGFDTYMTKPLDRAGFLQVIHGYLDESPR